MEADKSEQILEMMTEMNNKMDTGFNRVHEELGKVRSEMSEEFGKVRGEMSEEFGKVYGEIGKVRSEMSEEFGKVYEEFRNVYSEISDTKAILENETNKNIRIIAEGHRELNNKLDRALTIENEKELFLIRLNILENEVERIKARLN